MTDRRRHDDKDHVLRLRLRRDVHFRPGLPGSLNVPTMSRTESAACRSPLWRSLTRRIVVHWAVQHQMLSSRALEIGGGSRAMAERLLEMDPQLRVTVTDLDPAMVHAAAERLARFGDRAVTCWTDATRLPFASEAFDHVPSFIMLHHVIDWEAALGEVARVLKKGARSSATTCCRPRRHGPCTSPTDPPTA